MRFERFRFSIGESDICHFGPKTGPTYLNENDVIVLTPSGASGAAIPMHFSISLRAA